MSTSRSTFLLFPFPFSPEPAAHRVCNVIQSSPRPKVRASSMIRSPQQTSLSRWRSCPQNYFTSLPVSRRTMCGRYHLVVCSLLVRRFEVVHECEIVSVMAGWLVERDRDTLQGLFISSEGHCVILDELEPESKTNELMDIRELNNY